MPNQTSVRSRRTIEAELTSAQRLFLGGVGGASPVIVTMFTGELDAAVTQPEYLIGVGIRILACFGLGMFVVWLNDEVRGRYPVFTLGVTAPAVFIAMVSASSANAAEISTHAASAAKEVQIASLETVEDNTIMTDALPSGIFFQKCSVVDGFLGRKKCAK